MRLSPSTAAQAAKDLYRRTTRQLGVDSLLHWLAAPAHSIVPRRPPKCVAAPCLSPRFHFSPRVEGGVLLDWRLAQDDGRGHVQPLDLVGNFLLLCFSLCAPESTCQGPVSLPHSPLLEADVPGVSNLRCGVQARVAAPSKPSIACGRS